MTRRSFKCLSWLHRRSSEDHEQCVTSDLCPLRQQAVPSIPTFRPSMSVADWLLAVQNFMKALQYP